MKRFISAVIAAVMVLTVFVPAFAKSKACNCGFSPVIYVGPLGCSDIVRDYGTENEQRLWKTDTKFLLKNASAILPQLLAGIGLNDSKSMGDALVKFVNDSFGDMALDKSGNSKKNVACNNLNWPEDGKHGKEYSFYFDYDFRLDPFTHADRLNKVIKEIKKLTGHSKVQLKASSMGGVVLSAYLEKYGYSDVETIICQCCPLWGTAVAGELFCGKVELNATSLRRYAQGAIPFMDGGDFLQGTVYALTDILRAAGVWDLIVGLGDKLIEDLGERIFNECLIPIFGSMPGIWAFVPQEYYNNALKFMKVDKSSGLYKQIAHYRTAQSNLVENLKKARASGVKTYFFCGYNIQRTPLVTAWHNTSDGTVDTKYASLGATTADIETTLSEKYIKSLKTTKYLSPDKRIDASTCAFPDCTWFNRDWLHCNGQSAINEFYEVLLTSKKQLTVFSMKQYPQFLQNDDHAETLTPVSGIRSAKARMDEAPSYLNFIRMISSAIFG